MIAVFDCSLYPTLQDQGAHFCEQVSYFVRRLQALTEDEKERLALFKVLELSNALTQIRERGQASDRLGPAKAAASFRLVRAVIRQRQIALPGRPVVSLQDPALKAIIDQGCQLFHAGKQDAEQWRQSLALSTAQCIVLNPNLKRGLSQVYRYLGNLYPDNLRAEIIERFIMPYEISIDRAA
ncbi:hypothetical protein [Sphaerothrix gracilis]|uniref:hypothetical protein n=1 Tax=Sphaerothrix gracilis TaxID=3151835 RepID=UPI0031FD48E6